MRSRLIVTVAVTFLALLRPFATAPGQVVERIEPPSWWIESQDQALTLLIEGFGLSGAKVHVARGAICVERVTPGREGRALFVELIIPGKADAGACEIEIGAGGKTIRRRWELVAKPRRQPDPFGPDDVIYLVMIDRFANGDPSNDEVPGAEKMLDRRDTHAYHGGDFAGLRQRLGALAQFGITAVWLTPVYDAATTWFQVKIAGAPRKFADFHGYSSVDFYNTNPRFGSLSDYRAVVEEAHRVGLKVIQDHVLGHTGPKHRWVANPPSDDWFHGPIDHPALCNFQFAALTNPHARELDRRGLTDGWFAGILPDLNTRDPQASRYAIQQSLWWITLFGADGVRLDTYPMSDRAFWREWSRRLKAVYPDIRAVGEAWVTDPSDLSFFQGGRPGWDGIDPGIDTVFDFPLYQAAATVFSGRAPVSALAQTLARDGLYPQPEMLITFLDNHDTPRFAALPGVTPERLRLAVAFLLTTRGIPQITWGDELGLPGHMDDRRDFPGGFPGDARNAFAEAGRTSDEQLLFGTYRNLLRIRRSSPALRRGTLTELFADDSTYAYVREYKTERVVVALNLGKAPAELPLPAELSGAAEHLFGSAQWSDNPDGPHMRVPAESASIVRVAAGK
jgi:glycosidase